MFQSSLSSSDTRVECGDILINPAMFLVVEGIIRDLSQALQKGPYAASGYCLCNMKKAPTAICDERFT
jgi:hypothetical protein